MPRVTESSKSNLEIELIGDFFGRLVRSRDLNLEPKKSLEEFIKEVGGEIRICNAYEGLTDYPGIEIKNNGNFEISLPSISSRLKDHFNIAQGLGIYFLNTDFESPTNHVYRHGFGGWEGVNYQSKLFASALTMPLQEYLIKREKLKQDDDLDEYQFNIMLGANFKVDPEAAENRLILYNTIREDVENLLGE